MQLVGSGPPCEFVELTETNSRQRYRCLVARRSHDAIGSKNYCFLETEFQIRSKIEINEGLLKSKDHICPKNLAGKPSRSRMNHR